MLSVVTCSICVYTVLDFPLVIAYLKAFKHEHSSLFDQNQNAFDEHHKKFSALSISLHDRILDLIRTGTNHDLLQQIHKRIDGLTTPFGKDKFGKTGSVSIYPLSLQHCTLDDVRELTTGGSSQTERAPLVSKTAPTPSPPAAPALAPSSAPSSAALPGTPPVLKGDLLTQIRGGLKLQKPVKQQNNTTVQEVNTGLFETLREATKKIRPGIDGGEDESDFDDADWD
jgi:hypothetical protein